MVTIIVIIVSLAALNALVVWALQWLSRPKPNQAYAQELQRIDQAEQLAKDDIRRRRERAEDQLRRLSKWL